MKSDRLPLITIKEQVLFPGIKLNLDIDRFSGPDGIYTKVFVAAQKEKKNTPPYEEKVFKVGTIAVVEDIAIISPQKMRITITGISRARVNNIVHTPYLPQVDLEEVKDIIISAKTDDINILVKNAYNTFESYIRQLSLSPDILDSLEKDNLNDISFKIMHNIKTDVDSKQKLLEETNPLERLKTCVILIQHELEKFLIHKELLVTVKKNVEKHQRDYYLREHIKVAKEQLGESDQVDTEDYAQRIQQLNAGEIVHEKLNKELAKLKRLPVVSQEASVVREYLDLVLDLPWGDKTEENTCIENAKNILEEDHYGLDKVKERILEFLAVRHKTGGLKAPILCLAGPPGVGKTSIAKSIAKALNRKYVRISLGGLHDESEIRGHRKTYLGSMPGRIIAALRQSKKDNPLVLLDEVDKIGISNRGDPTSALLEVLDKEQNTTFRDNYVEVPYDISDILFICTANNLEAVPPPLRDRLDIIYLNTYTLQEKKEIALRYLIPKQKKEHALKDEEFSLDDGLLDDIINYYTKEAGVRQLERLIETLCRKAVKEGLEGKGNLIIDKDNLQKYLGKRKYRLKQICSVPQVGVAQGLAWTSAGGDTLFIEVGVSPGEGKLKLTGNVGKVMEESSMAAFSFIRSNYEKLNIDKDFHKEKDLHIHIPEGATPKDGPSAGITMTTAMISSLSNVPVKRDVAMTGEITLKGRVLPIGGVKEKVLAAKASGVKTVLLPMENEGDLHEIEEYIKEGLDFVLVEDIYQVIDRALLN